MQNIVRFALLHRKAHPTQPPSPPMAHARLGSGHAHDSRHWTVDTAKPIAVVWRKGDGIVDRPQCLVRATEYSTRPRFRRPSRTARTDGTVSPLASSRGPLPPRGSDSWERLVGLNAPVEAWFEEWCDIAL
jgi:hypothetical protein